MIGKDKMIGRDKEKTKGGKTRTILALLLAAGCRSSPPENVVLITIDTLRADHLGLYGYKRSPSIFLDVLAKDSSVFETAVPTCPSTAPSMASIMTGLHRASHRVMANSWILPAEIETLAEILEANGYRTLARIANPSVGSELGFAQGFAEFGTPAELVPDGPGMLEGEPLVAEAERLLDDLGEQPFFLWLHFMDPHGPYFPPERYQRMARGYDYSWPGESDLALAPDNYGLSVLPSYQAIPGRRSPADYRAGYDAEIRFVDDHVAAIVRKLHARGLWDRTLFVLTADHGESLGEHDYYFQHGWYLYDDCLRVPLLIHAPRLFPPGLRVPQSVSLVDVAPTILEFLGLQPGRAMEGRSLLPLLRDETADRPAFAQTYYADGLVGVRLGRWKYIFKPPDDPEGVRYRATPAPPGPITAREELYDVSADPGEMRNVLDVHPDKARELRLLVEDWLTEQERRGSNRAAEQLQGGPLTPDRILGDPQLERQLRALGYVN